MGGPWRVAKSLNVLLEQINAAYPNRSKVADGSIGDAAHAASVSDHNPDQYGVVRARDYTHDPAHGFDAHAMADALIASRDPRIKYVISRGRIASATISPWAWRTYTGTNRHDHHAHVSVVPDSRADNTNPWTITTAPTVKDDLDMTPTERADLINDIADEILKRPVRDLDGKTVTVGYAIGRSLRESSLAGRLAVEQAKRGRPLTVNEIDDIAKATVGALDDDYNATVTLTPKES